MFAQPTEESVPPVRCNLNLTSFPLAFQEVEKLQRADSKLANVIAILENGGQVPKYQLNKRVLYRKAGRRSMPKVVVPEAAVAMVFTYFHESPVGGHLGVNKTIKKVRSYFFWDAMDKDIRQRVKACHLCGLSKPAQNSKLGLLTSEVAERPLQSNPDMGINFLAFPHTSQSTFSLGRWN
jgi:hypothetical protein